MNRGERWRALVGLGFAAAVGLIVVDLYPKSAEPDGGFHFLKARWAFAHPAYFVDVWARPLFQLAFALPAQAGFIPARIFGLVISLAAAWNTYKLAATLGLARPWMAVPLLFLQPVWLVYAADTMTEPLFALVLAVALRLHHSRRLIPGLLVASLLPLARPEGIVLLGLWAVWILGAADPRPIRKRFLALTALGAGAGAWWLAALALTGDPLFIFHYWPSIWNPAGVTYGRGTLYAFIQVMPQVVGPIFLIPFVTGLMILLRRRMHGPIVSCFLALFALHSILWATGLFGSTGFPRYLMCVAPATAFIALAGWNWIAEALAARRPATIRAIGAAAVAVSLVQAVYYVDAQPRMRGGRFMSDQVDKFRARPRSFSRLAWSDPYACILFDRDPEENPLWTGDRNRNLALLRELPKGTLVLWDRDIGGSWHHVIADDFFAEGYSTMEFCAYDVTGRLRWIPGVFRSDTYYQRLDLLLNRDPSEPARR
jgi:hypothetical protein